MLSSIVVFLLVTSAATSVSLPPTRILKRTPPPASVCHGVLITPSPPKPHLHCGQHGVLEGNTRVYNEYVVPDSDHHPFGNCRDTCLSDYATEGKPVCISFVYDKSNKKCKLTSTTLDNQGYNKNKLDPNLASYNHQCFKPNCCGLTGNSTFDGGYVNNPSFEYAFCGNHLYQWSAQGSVVAIKANGSAFDGVEFTQMSFNTSDVITPLLEQANITLTLSSYFQLTFEYKLTSFNASNPPPPPRQRRAAVVERGGSTGSCDLTASYTGAGTIGSVTLTSVDVGQAYQQFFGIFFPASAGNTLSVNLTCSGVDIAVVDVDAFNIKPYSCGTSRAGRVDAALTALC